MAGNVGLIVVPFTWSFIYGLLHTIQPCEDKAIFGFHAFGIAKDGIEALKIVGVYALGLMLINNIFGFSFSALGNLVSVNPLLDLLFEFTSPLTSIGIGSVMYYRLKRYGEGDDHSAIPESLKIKKNFTGIFILGLLTGLPPCPFELAIYVNAFSSSTGYLINGVLQVFWFSIGTVTGLFILTLLVKSFRRYVVFKETRKHLIQEIALVILVAYGALTLVLNIMGISLVPKPPPLPEAVV